MSLEGPKKSIAKKEGSKSSIRDVIGATPEIKEEALQSQEEIFDKQEFRSLVGKEREKTAEDVEMISIANEATNILRRKFGLDDFDIPAKNIHMIPEDRWIRGSSSLGAYNSMLQSVIIKDDNISKLHNLANIIHEMIHFKAYNALQIELAEQQKTPKNPEGKPKLIDYRGGFEIRSRDGKTLYFTELNEAITEELNKALLRILVPELRSNPIFKDEMARTEKVVNVHSGTAVKNGRPFFDSDTVHAQSVPLVNPMDKFRRALGMKRQVSLSKKSLTYKKQRKMLNSLIDKVWKSHKEEFKDSEEIFDVFAKAYLTGNMLPVGRLVEDTFGKGSFRKIGELDMGTSKFKTEKRQS